MRLLEQAQPRGVMLTVAFHNRSRHFGKQFRLTHFLPMYYTVRQRGINTQFWARYTAHLPVDYRAGKRPAGPPDWRPGELTAAHLPDVDFVLLQRATPDNSRRDVEGSAAAEKLLEAHADLVRCDDLWCLYRTRG